MVETDLAKVLLGLLAGNPCVEVSSSGLLELRIGTRLLTIQTAWRARRGDIVVGSASSDRDALGRMILGQSVRRVDVCNEFHDLRIEFEAGIVIETFADNETYEHWQLSGGGPETIVGGPGRLWSAFGIS
jgi:hypothetical protein